MRADCLRRLCGAVLAALLCGGVPACLLGQEARQQDAAASASPTVTAVRVVKATGEVLKITTNVINVEVGQPLDPERVAASLKALYRTGDYSDIRAVSYPENGGVRLDFAVRENLFFNEVMVVG